MRLQLCLLCPTSCRGDQTATSVRTLIWRPRQELNLRPLAPEASALSAELRERDVKNHDEGQSTPRNIGTPSAVLHKAE